MSFFKIKKVYTENPYADELIYFVKKLALDTVLKNEQKALLYETKESLRNGSIYMMCRNGKAVLSTFNELDYNSVKAALDEAGYSDLNPYTVLTWCQDTSVLEPSSIYYKIVLNAQIQYFIDNYVELNEYYRMLDGLPPIDSEPIYLTEELLYGYDIPLIDMSIPLHEQTDDILSVLENYGILEFLYNEDPENRSWIMHLTKKVDPFYARKASKFEALFIPVIDSDAISSMYKDRLELNRIYIIRTAYSEAYKYGSDYYDNIMAIFIVLNTMIDIISRISEFITKKEIFDIRSCKYLFQSYGVTFFEEIPIRYQIKMIKNIHFLIKYKSTSKCMIDICNLFGFDNIQIFKYHLLKDRDINKDVIYDEDIENGTASVPMRFVKLPLGASADDYLRNISNYRDYDRIAEDDMCWNGGLEHDEVKEQILKLEFNYTRTKYYSIEAMYDLYKVIVGQCYFFNMLYDNKIYEEDLLLTIPELSTRAKVKLSDCFILLDILQYKIRGMKDMLMDTEGKILYIYGFNFSANMQELRDKVYRTRKEMPNPESKLFEVDERKPIKDGHCGDTAHYTLYNTGEMIISGYGEMYDYRYIMEHDPQESPWQELCKKIITIKIENGITRIGKFAFAFCINCIDVSIPDSVIEISDYAFWGCNSLGILLIPETVKIQESTSFGGYPSPLQYGSEIALKVVDENEGFIIPTETIPSIENFMKQYVNNCNAKDAIISGMNTADDYKTYNIYKDLYESLCIQELTMDFFCNPETGDYYRDHEGDATLTEFLRSRSPLLYASLLEIENYEGSSKENAIADLVDNIIYAIEEFIDKKEFAEIFMNIPTMDKDSILRYIRLVVDFYKSYKIELLGVNVVYNYDDKHEGYLKLIDGIEKLEYIFTKIDIEKLYDTINEYSVNYEKSQALDILDKMYMDISTWHNLEEQTRIKLLETIVEIKSHIEPEDYVVPVEEGWIEDRLFTISNDRITAYISEGIAEMNASSCLNSSLDMLDVVKIIISGVNTPEEIL